MTKTLSTLLFSLAVTLVCFASSAQAELIDTFSDGTIVNTSAPPTQTLDQAGLSGVIGTGDRRTIWFRDSGPGSIDLDLNNFVAGNALLSSSAATAGQWFFIYGHTSPFDVDLTDGDVSNSFVIQFAAADAGVLAVTVFDVDGDVDSSGPVPIPPLPSGGFVIVPFSLIAPIVDLHHAKEVIISIAGIEGGDYQMQILNTQTIPEPSSVALAAIGFLGLLGIARRRRK